MSPDSSPAAGDLLGPYQLVAPIGKGGMGEVWKALDTRLDRHVAIKISKAEFSAQFLREARMVAALNHPHICQLYDVAHNYLVMEIIEGQVPRGPVPAAKLLEWSCQVLDALGAAHRRGIVHLDLKPTNILSTSHGLKLLDFGLARRSEASTAVTANDATYVADAERKPISGTPGYMSPEQLQGKPLDARSDIFSFGCVLFEWATGTRAFPGENMASIIAAVLERETPPSNLSPALDRVLRSCLEKDPEERFQSVRDVKRALTWAAEVPVAPAARKANKRLRLALAGTCLAILAAIAGGFLYNARYARQPSMLQLTIDAGQEVSQPVLSPDGLRVAFVSRGQLALRLLNEAQIKLIPGTNDATYPFFSPDGKWLGYFSGGKMRKIPVDGGDSIVLCDAPGPRGASWGDDGEIVAALNLRGGLMRVPDSGGTPVVLLDPLKEDNKREGFNSYRLPWIIPGHQGILFVAMTASTSRSVLRFLPPNGSSSRELVDNAEGGRYIDGGYLVYYRGGGIFATKLDLARPAKPGPPIQLAGGAAYDIVHGAEFDVSPHGTMVYKMGAAEAEVIVSRLSASGRLEGITEAGPYLTPRLSPDGTRMALLVEQNGLRDLWVRDLASGAMKRLTFDAESHNYPVWTPNGEYIVMEAGDPGALVWVRADGSGREERTETVAGYPFPASLSPDGTLVTLWVDSGRTLRDIWLARIGMPSGALNIEKPKPLLSLPGSQISPRISPDGRWMAFGSDETGRSEIYVVPFATQYSGDSKKWRISKEGGLWPVWSPTGSTIYYRTDLGELMAAKYKAQGDAFVAENPRPWSEKRLATISVNANFDVALDGSVVGLFPKSEEPPVTDIKVMLNLRDAIAHAPKVEQ